MQGGLLRVSARLQAHRSRSAGLVPRVIFDADHRSPAPSFAFSRGLYIWSTLCFVYDAGRYFQATCNLSRLLSWVILCFMSIDNVRLVRDDRLRSPKGSFCSTFQLFSRYTRGWTSAHHVSPLFGRGPYAHPEISRTASPQPICVRCVTVRTPSLYHVPLVAAAGPRSNTSR